MKYLILFSFMLFSIPSICQDKDQIERGNNLIRFYSDSLANYDLFEECIFILKDLGYSFDQLDKDFYLCSTKPTDDQLSSLRIDLSVSKNRADIRSYVRMNISYQPGSILPETDTDQPWERGANRGLKTSLWMGGWDKQMEIVEKLKGNVAGRAEYITE